MPDLIENTEAVAPPAKKARKPRKPKQPAAPKATRAPRQTLAAWLKGRGPNHHEAANILGAQFKGDLRYALRASRDVAKAKAALDRVTADLEYAQEKYAACAGFDPLLVFAPLDELAASITKARTPKPSQDTDDASGDVNV